MKKLEINVPRNRESKGLKDGGHVILECSACGAPLTDCWITKPDFNIKTKLQAECPHCGDHSFEEIIKGGFHLGITDYTILIDQVYEESITGNNKVFIQTAKGAKSWPDKPL